MTDALESRTLLPSEESTDNNLSTQNTELVKEPKKKEIASREEVISKLKSIANLPIDEVKEEIEALKQLYYKLRKIELDTAKQVFVEAGNPEEEFVAELDQMEDLLKDLLAQYKLKKAEFMKEKEKVREENLQIKLDLLDKMNTLVEDADNISKHYDLFLELQHKFRDIQDVPPQHVNTLWKTYQNYTETFYDLLKINKELRDYDFKKNLERKEALCAEAEVLSQDEHVLAAFKKLQELHEEWRHIGPVSQSVREQLWVRFKTASTVINKRHQDYFDVIKEQESQSEAAKAAFCEALELFDLSSLKNFNEWEEKTKEVIALQEQWKRLGDAPRKVNASLYERFRKACDNFFKNKSNFFTQIREDQHKNLELKNALLAKAEALKESTDWNGATKQFVQIQKEWKTIGSVPRKQSDLIWKSFNQACDYFFEQKSKHAVSTRSVEEENLNTKRTIIARLKEISEAAEQENSNKEVRELMSSWNSVGHVPFKDKDKVYKEYSALLDILFERFNMRQTKGKLDNFASNVNKMGQKPQNSIPREREKLVRTAEQLKSELKTYENNMGFFTLSSKGAQGLMKEMERKMSQLKEEIALVAKKIEIIDQSQK